MNKKQIIELRKKGYTLKEIGNKFGVSSERIRQIIKYSKLKKKSCRKHHVGFYDHCSVCEIIESYSNYLEIIKNNDDLIQIECDRLSNTDRSKDLVIMRSLFIKFLFDVKKLNFSKVGRLLKRHHTSIRNLYLKKI